MNSTPTEAEWNPDENSIVSLSPPLGSWHFPPLWSHRGVKEAWYSHLISCKESFGFFLPLPLPPSSKPKRILPVRVRTESGAGPFLAQPLGLAQRLLRCSKAPEHASETPSFTAWLAGPHPHTQLNQMLHNLAHQISGEHVLHPTVKWLQIHLLGFSVS